MNRSIGFLLPFVALVTVVPLSGCGSDSDNGTKSNGGAGGGAAGSSTAGTTASGGTAGSSASGGTTATGGSSGGASGGATGGGGACRPACEKVAAANCGDVKTTTCASCVTPTTCTSEVTAYFSCVANKATVTCDTTAMSSQVEGCDAESAAYGTCAACETSADDSACSSCTKSTCCTEVKAYTSSSDAIDFENCLSPCADQACVDTCSTMYPNAGKAYAAAVACQTKSCTNDCVCGAQADDSTCSTCLKTNCCDLYAAYATSSDGAAFEECGQACDDQDCIDACAAASPIAGAAYNDLTMNCVQTTCVNDCGG
jgi:hypothetical protein